MGRYNVTLTQPRAAARGFFVWGHPMKAFFYLLLAIAVSVAVAYGVTSFFEAPLNP